MEEWNSLIEAFHVMNFSREEQLCILRTVAAVLHLGNVTIVKESLRADQAALGPDTLNSIERACYLLGIPPDEFVKSEALGHRNASRQPLGSTRSPSHLIPASWLPVRCRG